MADQDSSKGKTLYPAGETIDHYEIRKRIGYGSTSDVYEAHDTHQDRVVALKVLNDRRLKDPQARTRFHREASVQAMIRHDNVATVYDNGVTPANEPYLVLELFSGRCLRTVLNQETQVDMERGCSYALQALSGLAACHAAGVRHRDLKPENMMLRPSETPVEQVVLIDFGFASFEGEQRLTAAGFVVGSMSYVAPERLQGEVGDARADIYSMGIVLFELLAGAAPFEGDELSVAHNHLNQTPPRLRDVAPDADIPEQLEAIVNTALAKDPAQRYQSADAMAEELQRVIAPKVVSAPSEHMNARPRHATLWYCDTDGVETAHTVTEEPVLIGRAPECTIRSDDPLVSRRHAQLQWGDDGQYWIEDLDSTNGVWIGAQQITRAPLPVDDIALVGSVVLQLMPDQQPPSSRQLRPGMHTRLWSWLKTERASRGAIQHERNALGRRVGELHQAVEQLSRADGVGANPAAKKLAGELQLLRDNVRELRTGLAEADHEKAELASQLTEARRGFTKALQKQMANVFAAKSEHAELTERLHEQAIKLEDAVGKLRTREEESQSLRRDLLAMSNVSTVGAQAETLALVAAQTERRQLTDRVTELEDNLDEARQDLARAESATDTSPPTSPVDAELLEAQAAALTEELEQARWAQHQDHAAAVRLRIQLDSALSDVGQLRSRGADTVGYNAESLSRLELDKAALEERVASLEGELANLHSGAQTADVETVRLREELLGARAEVEAAWAEVEHLRKDSGGN